jgi:T5orf172 domain
MSPREPVDLSADKLWKLKREPAPTFFTLLVDQDRPDTQPELDAVTKHSFADCGCSCEKALRRFNPDPDKYVISDGVFALSIMCSTYAAVGRAVEVFEKICNLEPQSQTNDRQANLKSLIFEFAGHCEHQKILPKIVERSHHFVPYPIIPRSRLDHDGVPLMELDSGSDEEDGNPDQPVVSDFQAIFAYNTVINNALVEKLGQKLPRNPKAPSGQMPGYIYILKSPRIPDMLKIGVTTKDPPVRRQQWDRCYPTIQLHAYTSEVPYAKLVESLIHTELLAQRYMEDCRTCRNRKVRARSHTEWFKIAEQLAEQVVIRWAKWMGSRPYHTDTRTLSLTWVGRVKKAREKGYRPGVDYILCKEDTWQNFTDMRRPKGARDDSGAVELIRCTNAKSPFSD